MTWTITLPILCNSMNVRERQSFWQRKKELDMVTAAMQLIAEAREIPPATGRRWVKVTIHKGSRSRVRDDPANRDTRAKAILDAMVSIGLLVDDSETWLDWKHVIEGERRDAKHTIIELGDCDERDVA